MAATPDPIDPVPFSFRRTLPDYVTVATDGTLSGVDPDITFRRPARVVLTMPDFVADSLAHALEQSARIVEILDGRGDDPGGDQQRILAEALQEAVASAGYRCPMARPR